MKVHFDHQIFLTQKVGGISRYFYALKRALVENNLCEVDNWTFFYRNSYFGPGNGAFYLNSFPLKKVDDLIGTTKGLRTLGAFNELAALWRLRNNDSDVIHLTADNAGYMKRLKGKKPIVVTVHDLIPELYPDDFDDITRRLKIREDTFRMADHLICISESTKRDLKEIYGFKDDEISMVYHGPPDYMVKNREYKLINPETNSKQDYLLYVGDRKTGYKNFWPMVENVVPVLKNNKHLKLLCVGANFKPDELDRFERFGIGNLVESVHAREDELFSIYENAVCFILPSIYEGFGFPLLEAMKAGCPILSSNSSSLPEVGGNGALYFDPVSFDGFAGRLNVILNQKGAIEQLTGNQVGQLKKFSWKITAGQTYEVYKRLV
ncbi:MAG: hypothetical protein NVSMB24_28980 [Mucilaginibacter sp.]